MIKVKVFKNYVIIMLLILFNDGEVVVYLNDYVNIFKMDYLVDGI